MNCFLLTFSHFLTGNYRQETPNIHIFYQNGFQMHVFQKIDVTMTSILKTKTRICNEKGRFLKNQMTVLQGDFVFLHGFKKN